MQGVEFKVFSGPASDGASREVALRVPGGASLSRKSIDDLTKFVAIYGAKGLAWIKVNDAALGIEGLQSPIIKFIGTGVTQALMQKLAVETGDIIFFGADKAKIVNEAMGALRIRVAEELGLVADCWAPLWVVDFPMFEEDSEGNLTSLHHPFTAPSVPVEQLRENPSAALSRAYDMVLNGTELGAGLFVSTNHKCRKLSSRCLASVTWRPGKSSVSFWMPSATLSATRWHCLRLRSAYYADDRLCFDSRCDCFPEDTNGSLPLTDAPGAVSRAQLRELNIRLREKVGQSDPAVNPSGTETVQ